MGLVTNEKIEQYKLLLEEWKFIIQTQMHFNDMIMKMRTSSISIILAIFGAAAISLQYDIFLNFLNFKFHASILIIIAGLFMLFSVFLIDYFYYNKMLRGALKKSEEIDEAFKEVKLLDTTLFGLTTKITDEIGPPGKSKVYIIMFYVMPMIMGFIFIISILLGYYPKSATLELNSTLTSI